MTGKRMAQGRPSGPSLDGPDEPMHDPSTLAQITWKRSVSMGLPGPTMRSHQPGLPVRGWVEATCWSPVVAWQISTALSRAGFSVP